MSSPLAIAAVTAVLKDLLNDGIANSNLAAAVGTVAVSALPPDRIGTGEAEPSRLNLFLYQVTANAGWRNEQLPYLNGSGTRVGAPPLALDLHYLLSAYGSEDLDAEILLGYAMQMLHEIPVLTRQVVRKTFSTSSPVTDKLLPAAVPDRNAVDLADQVELCKITPKYLSTEELSRLWAAMQARFRPSMAYDISVVLIESTTSVIAGLPVRTPVLAVAPLTHPVIDHVEPPVAAPQRALTVVGTGLRGVTTKVRVGGMLVQPAASDVGDADVRITLPAALPAGVIPVQVVHEVPLGNPPTAHPGAGVESNVAALVLAPRITTASPVSVAAGATLTLAVDPPLGRDQRARLLVGDTALPVPARPATDPSSSGTLAVPIPAGTATGSFLLRVQVDGAYSPLEVDDDPNSLRYRQFTGPLVEVT